MEEVEEENVWNVKNSVDSLNLKRRDRINMGTSRPFAPGSFLRYKY